jgi:hypothetical protein
MMPEFLKSMLWLFMAVTAEVTLKVANGFVRFAKWLQSNR